MENSVKVLGFDLLFGLGLTAFVVWGRATFPALAASMDGVAGKSSTWKTFWVGLVIGIVAFMLFALTGKAGEVFPPVRILTLLILAVTGLGVFRGALAQWPSYGHRILGAERAASDLEAAMAGGALLTGTMFLFPVGFIFMGYVLVRSLGTAVLGMVKS